MLRRSFRRRQRFRLSSLALGRLLFGSALIEESDLEHILDVLDEIERHVTLDRLGNVDEIPLIELRQNDGGDLRSTRREDLLLHTADRRSEEHTSELQSQSNLVC